jgi:hypothetical protein
MFCFLFELTKPSKLHNLINVEWESDGMYKEAAVAYFSILLLQHFSGKTDEN